MKIFTTDEICVRLSGEDMAITCTPIKGKDQQIFLGNATYLAGRSCIEVWIIGNIPHTVAAWISVLEKRKSFR